MDRSRMLADVFLDYGEQHMGLERAVKQLVPSSLDRFAKLTRGHDPYYFKAWDKSGPATILRYWFWNRAKTKKNAKRVFVREIRTLLREALGNREFGRAEFKRCCPKTLADGECGYVMKPPWHPWCTCWA